MDGPNGARPPSAEQVIAWLGLEPHRTCGRVAESFVAQGVQGGTLYFLASPERGIQLHRIRHDQVYHHHLGDALAVLLVSPAGQASIARVGNDLASGERPQLAIPAGTFHAGRVAPGGSFGYALLGTSVWGRVMPDEVERMEPEVLGQSFPQAASLLKAFASS